MFPTNQLNLSKDFQSTLSFVIPAKDLKLLNNFFDSSFLWSITIATDKIKYEFWPKVDLDDDLIQVERDSKLSKREHESEKTGERYIELGDE